MSHFFFFFCQASQLAWNLNSNLAPSHHSVKPQIFILFQQSKSKKFSSFRIHFYFWILIAMSYLEGEKHNVYLRNIWEMLISTRQSFFNFFKIPQIYFCWWKKANLFVTCFSLRISERRVCAWSRSTVFKPIGLHILRPDIPAIVTQIWEVYNND